MAKNIKVIKCPQCGSPDKTELKLNHYICTSCGVEYFLDNDDININHTINSNEPVNEISSTFSGYSTKKTILFAAAVGSIIGVYYGLYPSTTQVYTPVTITSTPIKKIAKYTWSKNIVSYYENKQHQPIIIHVGDRYNEEETFMHKKTVLTIEFINGVTGKLLHTTSLNINELSKLSSATFDDGTIYFIVNEQKLYSVDKDNMQLTEVPSKFFSKRTELQSGIASITFGYREEGSSFNITTNDGKQLHYFPMINKIFTDDELYSAINGFSNQPKNPEIKTNYLFTEKSLVLPDEKLQLLQVKKKFMAGYPRKQSSYTWERNGSQKTLMDSGSRDGDHTTFKDFTPGRLYFSPIVLTYTDDVVLITFKPTLANTIPYSVQAINTSDAKILWTLPLPSSKMKINRAYVYQNGFILLDSHRKVITLDKTGKIVNDTIDLNLL